MATSVLFLGNADMVIFQICPQIVLTVWYFVGAIIEENFLDD
jgi:hypothetical protein